MVEKCWKSKSIQNSDFENQNQYKTVILKIKIKIITNYEFLKSRSKSIQNKVILKILFKIFFKLWVFIIHNNFIWVISDFSCQTWILYKWVEYIIYDICSTVCDKMRSYMIMIYDDIQYKLAQCVFKFKNSKRVYVTSSVRDPNDSIKTFISWNYWPYKIISIHGTWRLLFEKKTYLQVC